MERPHRANREASVTMDTLPGVEADLYLQAFALRVMAPGAGKRATLEEDYRADARTVVQSVPLDRKDQWVTKRMHRPGCLHVSSALAAYYFAPHLRCWVVHRYC